MFDPSSGLLSQEEIEYFKDIFNTRTKENSIPYHEFKEIILNFRKFDSSCLADLIDKIKKKIKEKNISFSENDLSINKNDYINYINSLAIEVNQYENMNDDDLRKLFEIISKNDMLDRKFLKELFYQYELPLSIDEFLEPIGKKDSISFSDFCLLFKCKRFKYENIIKSKSVVEEKDNLFPVTINKIKKFV